MICGKTHTVVRHRVDPLVEGRVQFCNDMLLPLLTHKTQEDLGLVDRILERHNQRVSSDVLKKKIRTMVRNDIAKTWFNLRCKLKAVMTEGVFGGCLNRCSGSGWSQYSSSHSTGKSRSKL